MLIESGVLQKVDDNEIINGIFVVPSGVTTIGESAFKNCDSLVRVELPSGVVYINQGAFRGCRNLTTINFPEGMEVISDDAFRDCTSLSNIEFPNSMEVLWDNAFYGCTNLRTLIIPENLVEIYDRAFYGCTSLTTVKFQNNPPDSLLYTGEEVFKDCSNLKEVILPESFFHLGTNLFNGCFNLKEITLKGRKIKEPYDLDYAYVYNYGHLTFLKIKKGNEKKFLLSQKQLIKKGYIPNDLSQEQKDSIQAQIEQIFRKCQFSRSRNYEEQHSCELILKMIKILGIDEIEKLLQIPHSITEEEIQRYRDTLQEIYEPKYKLKGVIPIVITFLENVDSYIAEQGLDRKSFYTLLNNELNQNESTNPVEILQKCAKELGAELNTNQLQKIHKQSQLLQFRNKEEDVLEKINAVTNNPEINLEQRGISSNLIYNVVKNNMLNGGTIEDIEQILLDELNKRNNNGTFYYGSRMRRQKNKLLQSIIELYEENAELFNTNLVELLKQTKNEIGQGWIKKLLHSKNGIKNLEELTKEDIDTLEENLKSIGISRKLSTEKQYRLRADISESLAYSKLEFAQIERLLTYEKAEMMFSAMKIPYSQNFRKWFIKNKDVLMANREYYNKTAIIHNTFDKILKDNPFVMTLFEEGKLTVDGFLKILADRKLKTKKGNEELGQLASGLLVTQEELEELEKIFEITKQREKSYIPQTQSTQKRYRGRILRADEPMNILAGNATDCCQMNDDVGEGAMKHGSKANNGRIFIVEEIDEDGKAIRFVAQSWVWRNKDTICFDNIEIPNSQKAKLQENTR